MVVAGERSAEQDAVRATQARRVWGSILTEMTGLWLFSGKYKIGFHPARVLLAEKGLLSAKTEIQLSPCFKVDYCKDGRASSI